MRIPGEKVWRNPTIFWLVGLGFSNSSWFMRGNDGTKGIRAAGSTVRQRPNYSEKLKFVAKKPPEEDSGPQSGERSKPLTLPTPS
jgi:hypothetical protein